MRYHFKDYALDTDRRELRRGANLIALAPKVFDLLQYLIRNRDIVVTKDDLIGAIWNGRIISDAALTTRLNAARTAVGDNGKKQHLIKTLPRKGFRFVGAVHEDQGQQIATAQGNAGTPPLTSAPRLSIVVLPFANLSGDLEHDYFVDGVTESLTTDLSRISDSFVIGRHTAFTFKGKAVDIKQVGRELNIRYVLEGSVQRSEDRLRVNVQLVDAETAHHLWADRFDKPVADLFDMQDEIVSRLANTLKVELFAAEARRSERSLHPDAMDLIFQGRSWLHKGLTPHHMAHARRFFEQAMALDPGNIGSMIGLAAVDVAVGGSLMTDNHSARFTSAELILTKALSLAPNHALAHALLGTVQVYTKRATQSIASWEHSLTLDHNLAGAHAGIGFAKYLLGRAGETEHHISEAFRLSPRDILAHRWMASVGLAKVQLNADAEAVAWLRRSLDANRNFSAAHFNLAATLARLGDLHQARAAVHDGLALDPSFTIRRYRDISAWSDNPTYSAGRERIIEGMHLAGVPEG